MNQKRERDAISDELRNVKVLKVSTEFLKKATSSMQAKVDDFHECWETREHDEGQSEEWVEDVEELEENEMQTLEQDFFSQGPATQRYLIFKASNEILHEIGEIKNIVQALQTQVEDQELRLQNISDDLIKYQAFLPSTKSNSAVHENVDEFEASIEADEDNFRKNLLYKKEIGLWKTAERALLSYFTKAKFRIFYSRRRNIDGKRQLDNSIFCRILREVFDDADECLAVILSKKGAEYFGQDNTK